MVTPLVAAAQTNPPPGLDGVIVSVDVSPSGGSYVLCWEHWAEGSAPTNTLCEALGAVSTEAFQHEAAPMSVSGDFYSPSVALSPVLEGDQLLRLQFLRRQLAVQNGFVYTPR